MRRPQLALTVLVALSAACSADSRPAADPHDGPRTTVQQGGHSIDVGLNAEVAAWQVCADDPAQVFAEAGTRDHQRAAEYVAAISTEEYRQRSIDGCLAGLAGEPPPAAKCEQQPSYYGCSAHLKAPTTTAPASSTLTPEERAFVAEMRERGLDSAAAFPQTDDHVADIGRGICEQGRALGAEGLAEFANGLLDEHLQVAVEFLCPELTPLLSAP